jgi:outer membrane protein OmpA-like peptidoglycan-associated protein
MNIRSITLTLLVGTLAACGSIRQPNALLEQARNDVNSAQNDLQVASMAPDELKQAKDALVKADMVSANGGTLAEVDHMAYMTSQRVVIARETASSKASQAISDNAAGERDKTRLAMRTREADSAKQQLAMAQQSNAQKSSELAAADATAAMGRARVNGLEMQLKDLNAKETDRGTVVTLGDVLFETGKSRLSAASAKHMAQLAAVFKNNPRRRASIEGYTDSTGSDAANLDLSQRRADAVMAALLSLGVSADLLTTRAHGEEQPAASNGTATGRQMNRRVEVVFAKQADGINMH